MIQVEVIGTPPSLNKMYAGIHWRRRQEMAEEWHLRLLHAFRSAKVPKPLKSPVVLRITQISKRIRDCDNAILSAKFCGDALVRWKYLPDDTPEYINEVRLRSIKGKHDRTLYEFFEKGDLITP